MTLLIRKMDDGPDDHIIGKDPYTSMGRPLLISLFVIVLILGIITLESTIWNDEKNGLIRITNSSKEPLPLIYTPGEIPSQINASIETTRQHLDELASMPDSARTVENTLVRFESIMALFDDQTLRYTFIGSEYQVPEVAREAQYAAHLRDVFLNDVYLRFDLAHALSIVSPESANDIVLQKKLADLFHLSTLPLPIQKNITAMGQNLSEIGSAYQQNQRDGNASSNLVLMPQIIAMRQQIVSLLGYRSFADYQIVQSGISSDQGDVERYLLNQSKLVSQKSHEEAMELLQTKKERDPKATGVYDYEIPGLRSHLSSTINQTISSDISSYFPVEPVITRTNALLSRILGISITGVPIQSGFGQGMHLFQISMGTSSKIQAWFYLWIKPESGSESLSGRTYYLRAGHELNGVWIPPVTVLILSVPTGKNGGQILLDPVDLQILFHEYGHVLRHSLATNRYEFLSSGTYDDSWYSELYSLFLEKFLWTPEVLDQISGKPGPNPDPLPEVLRDHLVADHGEEITYGPGYIGVYPMFLSLLDLQIHGGTGSPDFISSYDYWYENLTGFQSTNSASLLLNPAFFISDNAGTYWHYVLDETYATDLFSRFNQEGVLNQSTGISCRRDLFEPAGSTDPCILMSNFLGRKPVTGIGCSS